MWAAALFRQSKGDKRLVSKSMPLLMLPLLIISGISLATILAPSAQATSGVVKDMTFLLHSVNATETAKPLPGGGSTLTYFDTTLDFNDVNVSVLVEGTQKVLQWFLVPNLAGDFGVEGFTLRIWSNSSTAASSNAQVTVEIYELNETSSTLVHSENFGSQTFPVTPTLTNWNATLASAHTFLTGSSVELRLTVNPGAMQGVWFHYDTPQLNSRVSLRGPDSLGVPGVVALDWDRNPSIRFDPTATNKTMYIQAQVTDPLGGYDIRWVNLTLTSPVGVTVLDNVSMVHTSGTPTSFENVFEIAWNYSDQPTGDYTVLIWALDNNGHNHYFFFQQFDFADYPAVSSSSIFIGGLPLYVNVKAVDSQNEALAGATVALLSGGFTVDAQPTDGNGIVNVSLATGSYEFHVIWQEILVASLVLDVQVNVSESDPLVIATQVYSPTFQSEASEGSPLAGSSLLLTHPNGEILGPYKASASGQVTLSQVPVGTYALAVSWRGVEVFNGNRSVVSNDVIAFRTAVHELTILAQAGSGEPLAGASVSVADSTGLVFDAGLTGPDGTVVLLLPAGTYTLQARYVTSYMGSLYDSGVRASSFELSDSMSVTVAFSDFPLSFTNTNLFYVILGAVALLAILGFLLFKLMKRPGGKRPDLEESLPPGE